MRIARIRLRNWLAYRGEHELKLEPKVYAIVARREHDTEASNFVGKTALLESIWFAIYGEHRHRTEDDWVTRGEGGGEVEVEFDSGHRIVRARARGKRTSAYWWEPGATNPKAQAEADASVEALVGLGKRDFVNTCFFQQKAMSRFITSDPGERMKIISTWFRLEPLERCEAGARAASSDLESRAKEILDQERRLTARLNEIHGKTGDTELWPRTRIEESIPLLEAEIERRKGVVAELQRQLEVAAAGAQRAQIIADYNGLIEEGKKLKAEVDAKNLPALRTQHAEFRTISDAKGAQLADAQRLTRDRRAVALGIFDGACPVSKGFACPAKDTINSGRAEGQAAFREAVKQEDAILAEVNAARRAEVNASAEMQAAERLDARLRALREQAKKWQPIVKAGAGEQVGDPVELRKQIAQEQGMMVEEGQSIAKLRGWLEEIDRIHTTLASLKERYAAMEGDLGAYREAIAIFGKRGAQRRVAEGALARIEADANEMLLSIGADLSVQVRWSREGQGLAKVCEACGHPFPTSAKVKACERCLTARGPNLENKLDIVLSDRSGAAEDLAGCAVQLAASRWLRNERGTRWSMAMLDEPFGALDATHRRGLSRHLASMLGSSWGFTQAFICSHSNDVNNALPGRIEIVAGPNGSTPKVTA